jgi:hypothetical protein
MKIYTFKWRIPYNSGMEGQRYYKSQDKAASDRIAAMKRIYELGSDTPEALVSEVYELDLDDDE